MNDSSITIESILKPGLTRTDFPGSSKKKVLEYIAEAISEAEPPLKENQIFESLIARERLGSTGIGHGIAIPHSRLPDCQHVIGCLFSLSESVAFDAIDNQAVDILFVLIVPQEATSEHLELLSQIAEKFNDPNFCQRLRDAKEAQDLYKLMTE